MSSGIRRQRRANQLPSDGIGYIIIPNGVEESEFKSYCYTRERVCIMLEQGGSMVKDCYITKHALRDIEFPDISDGNRNKTGSCVVFVADGFNNKPLIVGVLSKEDESQLLTEFKFKQEKLYKNNVVSIEGDAEKGVLSIDVNDKDDFGVINISAKGKVGGKLNIICQSEANIFADEKINIKTAGEINLKTYNSVSGEVNCELGISNQNIEIKPLIAFKIGNGVSPIPKGDKNSNTLTNIKSVLDSLKTALSNFAATEVTASVSYPPMATGFSTLVSDLETIADSIDDLESDIAEINSIKSFVE